MEITLKNNFHNTEATVVVKGGIIKAAAMKAAERKLCGMKECTCGGVRGPQDYTVEQANADGDMRVGMRPK